MARSDLAKQAVLAMIRKEGNFSETPNAVKDFYTVVTDSIFAGKWHVDAGTETYQTYVPDQEASITPRRILPTTWQRTSIRRKSRRFPFMWINHTKNLSMTILIKYENTRLESKYPDFKNLMTEYRDGILLFDLTDQKVWSRATKDTTGLKDFYESNKNNYMWEERLEAYNLYNQESSSWHRK